MAARTRIFAAAAVLWAAPAWAAGVDGPAGGPAPDAKTVSALELGLHAGYGFMVQPKVNHAGETFSRNGGPGAALSVLYRSSFFLSPKLDLSFQPLYRSSGLVDLGASGGLAGATGSLRTLGVTVGAALDLWKVRVSAGIGNYRMLVRSSVNGNSLSASEWDMGYCFSAGGFLWESARLRVGLESRVAVIIDGGTTYFSIGAIAAGDALRW